jgi:hypothetical protein
MVWSKMAGLRMRDGSGVKAAAEVVDKKLGYGRGWQNRSFEVAHLLW